MALLGRLAMRSLSAKLLFLLSVALFPIGLIAVLQTASVVQEAEDLSRRDLLARTIDAARAQVALVRRAHGAAYGLGAAVLEMGTSSRQCEAVMRRFTASNEGFVFAGFIRPDGIMDCSSEGESVDFSGYESWTKFVNDPRLMIEITIAGAASGLPVLVATVPIFTDDGSLFGASSVSVPHGLLKGLFEETIEELNLALVSGDGLILSASEGFNTATEFEALGLIPDLLFVPANGTTVDIDNGDGTEVFAVVPLSTADAYVVGSWSADAEAEAAARLGWAMPLFPVAMWLVGLFVAFWAAEQLVLRHLRTLRRKMRSFSIENVRQGYVQLGDAPTEITEIAGSYNALLDRIVWGTAELENSVREKETLLKEVHHRVKNNLQLIASILNMQLRQIHSEDAQRVLRRVQDRVMSLATIHKLLYTDAQVDRVRADTLLSEIVSSTINVGSARGSGLKTEISLAPINLDPDQAVPLALLVTEATTNALKYLGPDQTGATWLRITLEEEDDEGLVNLVVANSLDPAGDDGESLDGGTSLGARLIHAFADQLGGESEVRRTPDSYSFHLSFRKLGAMADTEVGKPDQR